MKFESTINQTNPNPLIHVHNVGFIRKRKNSQTFKMFLENFTSYLLGIERVNNK